jgi:hypothetical protein
MKKEYKYDDSFKRLARKHQFAYREEVLKDFNEDHAPQVLLNEENAKNGLIFYEPFRDLILSKPRVGHESKQLTNDMLRSEHIPYNMFTPLETMPGVAEKIFSDMIGISIKHVIAIEIEYAGIGDKSQYLNDRTSFDAFVRYESTDGKIGGIGIEVKYTENSYPLGKKEEQDILDNNSLYHEMTVKSGYYIPELDIKMFLSAHHLRQIWRNHLLGFSMQYKGDIQLIHNIHLYPKGNTHFHKVAVPEYINLLADCGKESFKPITYERYFDILDKYNENENIKAWVQYLRARYLVKE